MPSRDEICECSLMENKNIFLSYFELHWDIQCNEKLLCFSRVIHFGIIYKICRHSQPCGRSIPMHEYPTCM